MTDVSDHQVDDVLYVAADLTISWESPRALRDVTLVQITGGPRVAFRRIDLDWWIWLRGRMERLRALAADGKLPRTALQHMEERWSRVCELAEERIPYDQWIRRDELRPSATYHPPAVIPA
jgi:hypothetical protein